MNLSQVEILHAQVLPHEDTGKPHLIQVIAEADLTTGSAVMHFYTVSADDGTIAKDAFGSATIRYEDSTGWKREWARTEYLIKARIDDLTRQAADGSVSKLSRNLVYELLRNVVDLEEDYRGTRSVVMADNDAFANVRLSQDRLGTWHSPPHWLDSVLQVGAVVCNSSDTFHPRKYFYVPYFWSDFRMVGRLEPGAQFQSYIRIGPMEEPHIFGGDLYILQSGSLVGVMTNLAFRQIPHILMNRFFSPSSSYGEKTDGTNNGGGMKTSKKFTPMIMSAHSSSFSAAVKTISPAGHYSNNGSPRQLDSDDTLSHHVLPVKEENSGNPVLEPTTSNNPAVERCLQIIARQTGMERSSLTDEASFVELGVDSLMSLVLSEKFRIELGLEIKNSVFLECLNIAELKEWVSGCC